MTFQTILEVAIGLILVYALFSLLATTFVELINTTLNRRGRMLEYGLYRILDDKKPERTLLSKLIGWRASIFNKPDTPKSDIADRFFRLQTVKSLMDNRRLPSYIAPDIFAAGLLTLINEDLGIEDPNKKYSELAIEKKGESRLARLVVELFPNQDVTRDALEARLRTYYEDIVQRMTGWFLRETQNWLIIVGVFVAVLFNIDSITLTKEIAVNSDLRARLVAVAESDKVAELRLKANETHNKALTLAPKTNEGDADNDSETIAEANAVIAEIRALDLPIGQCRGLFVNDVDSKDDKANIDDTPSANANKKNVFSSIGAWFNNTASQMFCVSPTTGGEEKVSLVTRTSGWLITAFALSLGAPFWFDLLMKFVALRKAGGFKDPTKKDNTEKAAGVESGKTTNASAGSSS